MKQNYYLIGSKYGENNDEDIFPQMIEKSAISVGFAWYNLSELYGKPEGEIIDYLKKKKEESRSYSALRLFLNLKEGDLIAIKSTGSPVGRKPRLIICGYAVVKKIDGKIYDFSPKDIGHLIYVDFLEVYNNRELELGYGKTIHKLTKPGHIKRIFGAYYEPDLTLRPVQGVTTKNINPYTRTINASLIIIYAAHNKLQLKLYNQLIEKYGKDKIKMEDNFVDLKLIEKNKVTFFEVKPYNSASLCITEALGQVLEYIWKERKNALNSKIVVVGNTEPTKDEKNYIEFLKENLKIEFDYQWLDSN